MKILRCFHCGKKIDNFIQFKNKNFCCYGCKTVYEIIQNNGLENFYKLNINPGITSPKKIKYNLSYLDHPNIKNKIIDFINDNIIIIRFFIPSIHCTSCIFILENLYKINSNIINSNVDFNQKNIIITFKYKNFKISDLVKLLTIIGYKPILNLKSLNKKKQIFHRVLIYKIFISFFCFANIMLLSFPEYINITNDIWLINNINFFRWTMFILSLPSMFFCALDYFKSALYGIKNGIININIPISLGMIVLFIKTLYEIYYNIGPGYSDTLTGLIFFLLCGKYFQIRTYKYIFFEQDYKYLYPISVTKIINNTEQDIFIDEINVGDKIIIHNEEIIPVDSILINGNANIDNSFITGESRIIHKNKGDYIYAGGKQKGSSIEIKVLKKVDHSYLIKLWNYKNNKKKNYYINNILNQISIYFTSIILIIALITGFYWYIIDINNILNSVCSVLIIACPCALSLSIPFTLGNIMRISSKKGFFFKDIYTIERISKINTLIFDKTGTITDNEKTEIDFIGKKLSFQKLKIISSLLRNSTHPLSRILYKKIKIYNYYEVLNFKEIPGKGLEGIVNNNIIKIGSENYIKNINNILYKTFNTKVFISINNKIIGYYLFHNSYRKGLKSFFKKLHINYEIYILSGDNSSEYKYLKYIVPDKSKIFFNQNPYNKLKIIKSLQMKNKKNIMMFGDGLNDIGALKQSEIGVTICNGTNIFSPYCDILIDSKYFNYIPNIINLCKKGILLVKVNFFISIIYNLIGISFAITGKLDPIISAILMSLSSISVIFISIIITWIIAYKNNIIK